MALEQNLGKAVRGTFARLPEVGQEPEEPLALNHTAPKEARYLFVPLATGCAVSGLCQFLLRKADSEFVKNCLGPY